MAELSSALSLTVLWLAALVVVMVFIIVVTQGFKTLLHARPTLPAVEPTVQTSEPAERPETSEEMAAAIAAVTVALGVAPSLTPTAGVGQVGESAWKVAGRLAALRAIPVKERLQD